MQKKWIQIHSKEPVIKISRGRVFVENLRDFRHFSDKQPAGMFIKKEYDLKKLKGVWFAIDPLSPGTSFAHTFFSFEFGDDFLVISVEARRRKISARPGLWGFLPLFKVYYSASTEKDMFTMRAKRKNNLKLLLFKLNLNFDETKKLLVELQKRMDHVHQKKTVFNSVYRNCTTEILACLDRAAPKKLGRGWRRHITSHIDKLLVKKNLTTTKANLQNLRSHHDIKKKVLLYKTGNFSKWIRKDL